MSTILNPENRSRTNTINFFVNDDIRHFENSKRGTSDETLVPLYLDAKSTGTIIENIFLARTLAFDL